MAAIKNYNLIGVGQNIQFSKGGVNLQTAIGAFTLKAADGTTNATLTAGGITSTSTISSIGLSISNTSGTYRTLDFQTSGSDRWLLRVNNTTESGSNVGSDLELVRVADNGSTQNLVYSILRSTGVVDFKATPTINGTPIGSGTGTVTSVAATVPAFLSVSGSPITSSGTLAFTLSGTALPLANGGTGATTQSGAANAILPSQASQSGKYLTTNGTNVSWATVSGGGTPGGSTTQVQYNNAGAFAGDAGFTYAVGTGTVTATNLAGAGSAITSLNASNLSSGTVPIGQLGSSGTPSTSTFLRGDNSWSNVPTPALIASSTTIGDGVNPSSITVASGNVGSFTLQAGNGNGTTNSSLNLNAGNSNTGSATGGSVVITTGGNVTAGSGVGNVVIQGNPAGSYTGTTGGQNNGAIQFWTGAAQSTTATTNTLVNRLTIQAGGAWTLNSDAGTSGYVLTSAGAGAPPTWAAQTASAAGSLTGTTLASNVVNSSLTSVGTLGSLTVTGTASAGTFSGAGTNLTGTAASLSIGGSAPAGSLTGTTLASNVVTSSLTTVGTVTTGTWSGSFGAVSGANLTTLNASNLSSGTVGTARLGSGTANNTTFLRGDNTWVTPAGTGTVTSVGVSSNGTYAGAITVGATPVTTSGTITLTPNIFTSTIPGVVPLSGGGTTNFLRADGTWATPSVGNATNLSGGAAGEIPWQSAASTTGFTAAGTSGQILTSGGTAVPTWSSTFTGALALVGAAASTASAINVTAGVNSSNPFISLNNSTSGSQGLHSTQIYADSSGIFHIGFWNDSSTTTDFLTVTRTAGQFQTPQAITLTGVVSTTLGSPTIILGTGAVTLTTSGTGNALTINTPAGANTGAISIIPGTSSTSTVGSVTITGGATSATSATGGAVNITGGAGTGTTAIGGDVVIKGGTGTQTNGATLVGQGSPATTATSGFSYMPAMAGAPTGVPTAKTGFVPFVYDTTNHKLWIYDGGWKTTTVFA